MNLANKLTILRMIMVPVFVIVFFSGEYNGGILSAVIFIIAAITDRLDGQIARRRGEVTDFGKFMDPLADKMLVSVALIALVNIHRIPAWIAMLIIVRELAMSGIRVIAAQKNIIIAASNAGKIKTVLQTVSIGILLFPESTVLGSGIFYYLGMILLYLAVFMTVWSVLQYYAKYKTQLFDV